MKVKPGCFLFLLSVAATHAVAQTPNPPLRVVPPPPIIAADAASGKPAQHAIQSAIDSEHAFDPVTGDGYNWDCVNKTWINTRTKESIGFAGETGRGGEIIPPPPLINGNQPQTNRADADHALEEKTGTSLVWDRDRKTWRESKTGKDVGYRGIVLRDTCPSTHALANASPRYKLLRPSHEYGGWYVGFGYESRNYLNLKHVSGDDPIVASNDVNQWSNGFGGRIGFKLPGLPAWGEPRGYWAGGLTTRATLTNGHRVENDVTDYGLGFGIRMMPSGAGRFYPHLSAAAMYEWNKGIYREFNQSDVLALTEQRKHTTWTGDYALGATFWIAPSVGIDTDFSYNGIFKRTNANENLKLSAGLVLRLGQ